MRGKKIHIDDWDKPISSRAWSRHERVCDMREKIALHRKGDMYYISLYKQSKNGISLNEIKKEEHVSTFVLSASTFLKQFIGNINDWCIITTPRRRHHDGYHFATAICQEIADKEKITFYENAFHCISKDRVNPEFFLLRKINENRVILFDDIITTGKTLTTCYNILKKENKQILAIVGINNN